MNEVCQGLKKHEIDFFFKNGYLLIKDVYDKDELNKVRNSFILAFEKELWKESKYNSKSIINDIYRIYPKLIHLVINEKYIKVLKSILGKKLIWLPECAVHFNRYTDWHSDTTEQEIKGITSHKNLNEHLIQCATYFQSNSDSGGGLTVIPGSHLTKDPFTDLYKKEILHRLINKVKKIFRLSTFDKMDRNKNAIQIPSETGDLVLFDVRLDHKSTRNISSKESISKFAIFNTFGNDNNLTKDYLEFMKLRPEPYYQFLQNTSIAEILHKKANSLNIKIWK